MCKIRNFDGNGLSLVVPIDIFLLFLFFQLSRNQIQTLPSRLGSCVALRVLMVRGEGESEGRREKV